MAKSDASKSSRNARSGDPSKRAANEKAIKEAEAQERHKMKAQKLGNPSWFVPVMLGLMIIGGLWVVTFYITQQQYPVPSLGNWNLGVGFVLIMAGFLMTTRWK
ncbi:cell division protein CrgA [Janibacter corallicola]|uniref:cell division protein CrgA n=1 Tax=Janibacter corallicola TaxID=415212 RepID=UPI0009FE8C1F|nr:cell division protein CrgA [Janibacter corallicola]